MATLSLNNIFKIKCILILRSWNNVFFKLAKKKAHKLKDLLGKSIVMLYDGLLCFATGQKKW